MKRTSWWLTIILVLAGCQTQNTPQVVPTEQTASSAAVASTAKVRIATFNIQNFGLTKAGRPAVMQVLAIIIRKYDVVAVQEVSDITEKAPHKLLDAVNADGSAYALLLSERTGKQPDDRSSQEQYAFYYNTGTVRARDTGTLYPDDSHDYFQREPFVAGFERKNSTFRFVLVTIHTMPERAFAEIASLKNVVGWVKTQYPGENDFILLGDFNAGCSPPFLSS